MEYKVCVENLNRRTTWEDNVMSLFERNRMGGLDCFCLAHDKGEWRFLLYIVISNTVHRQLCWYIDTVNIVLMFLYAVFYNCHHPLDFLKGKEFLDQWSSHNCVRKKSSAWRLFLSHVLELFI
jgi:hypothetical protein